MTGSNWLSAPFVLLAMISLGLLAAKPGDENVDALIRAGNHAFDQGDTTTAIARWQQARRLTKDPGLVAFNLATAHYHRARAGDLASIAAAENGYRCCLENNDPRRARAHYGLGNCLLLRGSVGTLDAVMLRLAIDRYTLCLREPHCDEELAQDARYNRQRARLLLLQTVNQASSESDAVGEPNQDKDGNPAAQQKKEKGTGKGEDGVEEVQGKPDLNTPIKEETGNKGQGNSPGKGAIAPISDKADAPPPSDEDAKIQLEGAMKRIQEDWQAHRRNRSRGQSGGMRDW